MPFASSRYSALILASRTTPAHLAVSDRMSLSNASGPRGVSKSTPTAANRSLTTAGRWDTLPRYRFAKIAQGFRRINVSSAVASVKS